MGLHIFRAKAIRKRNKKALKERLRLFCFLDITSSFILVVIVFMLKLVMTVVYVVRAAQDQLETCEYCGNSSLLLGSEINWDAIIWIQRPLSLWITEVAVSAITLSRMITVTYLRFKGDWYRIVTFNLTLETVMSLPFIITIFYDHLRHFYIPSFFNCWLAKRMLDQNILSHRRLKCLSLFIQKAVAVMTTLICLVFSGVCAVQHLQRGSTKNLTLFQTFYFVMVTLSTVGYGDISPDIWPSRLFVIALIVVAVIILPKQFESLAYTWHERQEFGGSYGGRGRSDAKHVVVCSTSLSNDAINDFLSEFYCHRQIQDYYTVFMSPTELDPIARRTLQSPLWLHRTMYLRGSCLRDTDLARAGMREAKACFLLNDGAQTDRSIGDQHTILRSWSVKDYASNIPQYIQLFRPENKVHLKFSQFTVCEDEFKYAMLAYNCLIPGTSTLLTLLLHTSNGDEGVQSTEDWLRLYGKCSGNEIYAIKLSDSFIFGQFENANFTHASLHAHKRHGVILIGVQTTGSRHSIIINPGPKHVLRRTDTCIYVSLTKEEDMTFTPDDVIAIQAARVHPESAKVHPELVKNPMLEWPTHDEISAFAENQQADSEENLYVVESARGIYGKSTLLTLDEYKNQNANSRWVSVAERCEIVIGYLPVVPYVGMAKILCHIRKTKKSLCCLSLDQACRHCCYNTVKQYSWANKTIIFAALKANLGFYNFIIPLRAYYHQRKHLKPIILMLEQEPDGSFLDVIAWFPLVYWMKGSIGKLDDLLTAGINYADSVVIISNESKLGTTKEDDLADSETIVNVQMLQRYFPKIKFTTELIQASNMRFMQFQANNECSDYLSEMEKMEKEKGSSLSFMFRLPFAAGDVFSVNMVDTMLYQGYLKDYLIPVVRRILGIAQTPGGGFLTSLVLSKKESWAKTYGSMFTFLCAATGDIPIGIYRTETVANDGENKYAMPLIGAVKSMNEHENDESEINNLIKNRLKSIGLSEDDYDLTRDHNQRISFVIINPNHDLELHDEDIVFVLRPSLAKQATASNTTSNEAIAGK